MVVAGVLMKQKTFDKICFDSRLDLLTSIWHYDFLLNFDNVLKDLPVKEKINALARGEGGEIGSTRLELGIAGRKKKRFMHCF